MKKSKGPPSKANAGEVVEVLCAFWQVVYKRSRSENRTWRWEESESASPEIITVRHWGAILLGGHCICWAPIVDAALQRCRHCRSLTSWSSQLPYLISFLLKPPLTQALYYKHRHLIWQCFKSTGWRHNRSARRFYYLSLFNNEQLFGDVPRSATGVPRSVLKGTWNYGMILELTPSEMFVKRNLDQK